MKPAQSDGSGIEFPAQVVSHIVNGELLAMLLQTRIAADRDSNGNWVGNALWDKLAKADPVLAKYAEGVLNEIQKAANFQLKDIRRVASEGDAAAARNAAPTQAGNPDEGGAGEGQVRTVFSKQVKSDIVRAADEGTQKVKPDVAVGRFTKLLGPQLYGNMSKRGWSPRKRCSRTPSTPSRSMWMQPKPTKAFKLPAAVIQSVHKERRVEAAYRRKFPDSDPPNPGLRLSGETYMKALEKAIEDGKPLNFADIPGAIY